MRLLKWIPSDIGKCTCYGDGDAVDDDDDDGDAGGDNVDDDDNEEFTNVNPEWHWQV